MGLCESEEIKQARQARELEIKIREKKKEELRKEQEREEREYHLSICKRCKALLKIRIYLRRDLRHCLEYDTCDFWDEILLHEWKKYTSQVPIEDMQYISNLLFWNIPTLKEFWIGDFIHIVLHENHRYNFIPCIIDNVGYDYEKEGEIKYFVIRPLLPTKFLPHNVFYEEIDLTNVRNTLNAKYLIDLLRMHYCETEKLALRIRIPVKTSWTYETMVRTVLRGRYDYSEPENMPYYLGAIPVCVTGYYEQLKERNIKAFKWMQDIMEDQ